MSIEGGNFRCYLHTDKKGKFFETASIEEWNAHCTTAEGHREEGQAFCAGCGDLVMFSLPFHPLGPDGSKGVKPIFCNECDSKKVKDIKVVKLAGGKIKK